MPHNIVTLELTNTENDPEYDFIFTFTGSEDLELPPTSAALAAVAGVTPMDWSRGLNLWYADGLTITLTIRHTPATGAPNDDVVYSSANPSGPLTGARLVLSMPLRPGPPAVATLGDIYNGIVNFSDVNFFNLVLDDEYGGTWTGFWNFSMKALARADEGDGSSPPVAFGGNGLPSANQLWIQFSSIPLAISKGLNSETFFFEYQASGMEIKNYRIRRFKPSNKLLQAEYDEMQADENGGYQTITDPGEANDVLTNGMDAAVGAAGGFIGDNIFTKGEEWIMADVDNEAPPSTSYSLSHDIAGANIAIAEISGGDPGTEDYEIWHLFLTDDVPDTFKVGQLFRIVADPMVPPPPFAAFNEKDLEILEIFSTIGKKIVKFKGHYAPITLVDVTAAVAASGSPSAFELDPEPAGNGVNPPQPFLALMTTPLDPLYKWQAHVIVDRGAELQAVVRSATPLSGDAGYSWTAAFTHAASWPLWMAILGSIQPLISETTHAEATTNLGIAYGRHSQIYIVYITGSPAPLVALPAPHLAATITEQTAIIAEQAAIIAQFQQQNILSCHATTPIADICFPAGTPVTTDQGIIAIEKLIPGTHTIKEQAIVGISRTKSSDNHLLCFEKHALGHNIPDQQTIMNREHCILYKGKMKRACTFMRYARIRKVKYTGETLYNVVLEKHGSMVVNNMTVETLHPKHWVAQKISTSTFKKS